MRIQQGNEPDPARIHTFTYVADREGVQQVIEYDVTIPLPEYMEKQRLFAHLRNICNVFPPFIDEVRTAFYKFIVDETDAYNNARANAVIKELRKMKVEDVVAPWLEMIRKRDEKKLSNEVQFSDQFQFVMESAPFDYITTIIAKETKLAEEMGALVSERDSQIESLEKQCETEFAKANNTEDSALVVSKLNEQIREMKKDYKFKIKNLAERQRTEYQGMIKSVYEMDKIPDDIKAESPPAALIKKSMSFPSPMIVKPRSEGVDESFTIYIGAQLKSMHNVRLMTCEKISDMCGGQASSGHSSGDCEDDFYDSSRLQNAMSLYRRGVSAVVLLVEEKDPLYHIRHRTDFARLCERSTELHFSDLEEQLQIISDSIRERNKTRVVSDYSASSSSASLEPQTPVVNEGSEFDFRVGDVYITKHSNLSSVHVVFHLVVDGSLENDDISSRHPTINGIRNVIRLSAKYGVTNITFPLLLVETAKESMNATWCLRRAELMLKCAKGFMMEVCATGSTSSTPGGTSGTPTHYNINFALPSKLRSNIYPQLVEMLPTVFHLVSTVTG